MYKILLYVVYYNTLRGICRLIMYDFEHDAEKKKKKESHFGFDYTSFLMVGMPGIYD